jgi:hypothetical protein
MYMRYAGGGVGHYRVTLTDTPNANEIQEDFAVEDDVTADPTRLKNLELEERIIVAEAAGLEEVEEAERIQDDDNIEDHCSDSEGEEDDEENSDEDASDDLGAEDGEGGFLDAEDDEGYAPL